MTIYKGGVPARYGGRLSGVVDLRLRDGRSEGRLHEFGIGLGLLTGGSEGEVKENVSYLVAGRFAYPLLIDQLLNGEDFVYNESGTFSSFGLGDGVAKLTYRKEQTKLSFSYFRSGDTGFAQSEGQQSFDFERFGWATNSLALNGVTDLSSNLTASAALGLVNYRYRLTTRSVDLLNGVALGEENNKTISNLVDLNGRLSLTYAVPNFSVSAGAKAIRHNFAYTNSGTSDDGGSLDTVFSDQRALRYASFLDVEGTLFGFADFGLGIRRSGLLDPDFAEWEPRLRLGLKLPHNWALNFGAGRQVQYVHRLRAAQTIFPNEFWQIATEGRPPAVADQVYGGFARSFPATGLFISAEVFTQRFDRLTETDPLLTSANSSVGDLINGVRTDGMGTSRGLEVYLDWQRDRWDVSLAYTWAKTDRQFPELNDGEVFPFTFDRRHDIAVSGTYRLPRQWTLTGVFIYQTGRAITVPTRLTRFYNIYERINNARFPSFHLLNLGVEKRWSGKYRKHISHVLSFSTYNTYNRENPYSIGIEPVRTRITVPDPRFPNLPGQQVTVSLRRELKTSFLFPFIPGVAYRRTIGSKTLARNK